MGCFVRGGKNGMGCFVRGDKNCMGCFVRGGKLMRDVLSGVAKNGMGCFVPGCFVLHSLLFSKSVDKKNVWPYETLKLAKKVQKGISDSDKLNYYLSQLCVKCWHC